MKKIVSQFTHKKCGGEITTVLVGKEVKFVCKACLYLWELPEMFKMGKPDDWKTVKRSS